LAPPDFLLELDRLAVDVGPHAAAERFLITVLGEAAWSRLPRVFQERSSRQWGQIRGDCLALEQFRVDYAGLSNVMTPMRLLGGDRSAPYFQPTLAALAAALPHATMATVVGAGHMLHADAPRALVEQIDLLAAATSR
jgi:pimeloyl-ACP methyl ester carboxylesterase